MDERRSRAVDVVYELIAAGNTTETAVGLAIITQLERIANTLEKQNSGSCGINGQDIAKILAEATRGPKDSMCLNLAGKPLKELNQKIQQQPDR